MGTIPKETFSTIAVEAEDLVAGRIVVANEMSDYISAYFLPMFATPTINMINR